MTTIETPALLAPPADAPAVRPKWAAPAPGVYEAMPDDEYHAVESMSYSGGKRILKSPQHYRLMRTKPTIPTDAMQFGKAVHCGILEPHRYAAAVVQAPSINRRTNAGKAEYSEFCAANGGKVVLSPDEYAAAARCIDAVLSHPTASRLLEGAIREISLFWIDAEYKVPCKARLDARNHGGIIDVKTTIDASPEGFAKQAANFMYHMQGAHYWSGWEHLLDESPQFFADIAVESEEPHAVACYWLPAPELQVGRRKMDEALYRYQQALALGTWPGYPEEITPLHLPRWALRHEA